MKRIEIPQNFSLEDELFASLKGHIVGHSGNGLNKRNVVGHGGNGFLDHY